MVSTRTFFTIFHLCVHMLHIASHQLMIIGFLSMTRELNLLKSSFKALCNTETWPDYLKIIKQECPKELCSSNSIIRLVVPTENGTFQDNVLNLIIYQKLLDTVMITEPF